VSSSESGGIRWPRRRKSLHESGRSAAGILGHGRYPIPVLEQTYGLTSRHNVIFGQASDRMWQLLDLTFDSILESEQSSATEEAVVAVNALREDLGTDIPAGAVMKHPSSQFAEDVAEAIRRCLPDATVTAASDKSIADYEVAYAGQRLLVESKWQADLGQPFAVSTLSKVIEHLPNQRRLLVVVDAPEPPAGERFRELQRLLDGRVKIACWQGEGSDENLVRSLTEIFDGVNRAPR